MLQLWRETYSSVAFWGCEVLKKETRVQQVKKMGKLLYAEAVKEAERGVGESTRRGHIVNEERKQEEE